MDGWLGDQPSSGNRRRTHGEEGETVDVGATADALKGYHDLDVGFGSPAEGPQLNRIRSFARSASLRCECSDSRGLGFVV